MSRFWPFRSFTNFSLTILGVGGIGFYGYGMYKQTYFSNPVVSQAVKILGKNQKVKQMIGYPLSYQSSIRNKFNQNQNQQYYSFKVMGPRGSTQVQVTAKHLKAKQVYEYDTINQSLISQENKSIELKKIINDLNNKLIKAKKKEKIQIDKEKQNKLKQLKEVQSNINKIKEQKKNLKNSYCIPDKQFYAQIISQTGKNNQKTIPEQGILYKLQNVACQLPNKSRITIINDGNLSKPQDYSSIVQQQSSIKIQFQKYTKPIYGPFHQKLSINVSDLSEQQIQQYGKHKTNFMYQRYGMYRMVTFMVVMIGAAGLFLYFAKNKTKNMTNSVLYQLTLSRIEKNKNIQEFMKKNKIKILDFDKNVGGGMRNNHFNCLIGLNNVPMGKVQIIGKYISKEGKYQYQKFIFKYLDENNQHKQIDLLK